MKGIVPAVLSSCAVGLVVFGLLDTGGADSGSGASAAEAPTAAATAPDPIGCAAPSIEGLTPEQVAIARIGVKAAKRHGVGDRGAAIIIAAGLVESELKDLDYGDRDSIGWLQQRPSQGWRNAGNPVKAADDFLDALKKVDGWQSKDPGAAAQAVQGSAHPERYGRRMAQAQGIVAAINGAKVKCTPAVTSAKGPPASCPPSGSPAEAGLRPQTLRGLRCGAAAFPKVREIGGLGHRPIKSDHPMGLAIDLMVPGWTDQPGRQYGWRIARWYEANAANLRVKYVIYDDKIWSASRSGEGWRTYTHPTGDKTNATLRHLDHVHVSFTEG